MGKKEKASCWYSYLSDGQFLVNPVASRLALSMQTIIVRFRNCLEHCDYPRVMSCTNCLHSLTLHLCCLLLTVHTHTVIVWPLTLRAWSALKTTNVFQWWIQKYPYREWIQKDQRSWFRGVRALWSRFHKGDFMVAVSTAMLKVVGVWVYWYCNS